MSHISRIKTQIKDLDKLTQAIEAAGGKIETNVQNVMGDQVQVAFTINLGYDFSTYQKQVTYGFALEADGTYGFRGDMWNVNTATEKLLAQINQHYARQITIEQLALQGYTVTGEETDSSGNMRLVLGRL